MNVYQGKGNALLEYKSCKPCNKGNEEIYGRV